MPRTFFIASALALATTHAAAAYAGDFRGQARAAIENTTPSDVKLAFTPQKMKWEYDKLYIWGTISNVGSARSEFVQISITALDKDRNFLGRQKWYIEEQHLNAGETGTLDGIFIETEGRVPAILQLRLSGNNDD